MSDNNRYSITRMIDRLDSQSWMPIFDTGYDADDSDLMIIGKDEFGLKDNTRFIYKVRRVVIPRCIKKQRRTINK